MHMFIVIRINNHITAKQYSKFCNTFYCSIISEYSGGSPKPELIGMGYCLSAHLQCTVPVILSVDLRTGLARGVRVSVPPGGTIEVHSR